LETPFEAKVEALFFDVLVFFNPDVKQFHAYRGI
jgi:hypothetical protein